MKAVWEFLADVKREWKDLKISHQARARHKQFLKDNPAMPAKLSIWDYLSFGRNALKGDLKPIITKLVAAGIISSTIGWAAIKYVDYLQHLNRGQALEQFNSDQEKKLREAEDKFKAAEKATQVQLEKMKKQLQAAQQQIDDKDKYIEKYLNSKEAKQYDRPSSEVLKETFRRLSK